MRATRQRHHARVLAALHRSDQERGEREVAEVVGPELELEAVGGPAAWRRHDAGVVDQQVEAVVRRVEALGEGANRIELAEVELLELELGPGRRAPDGVARALALRHAAAREHDARTGPSELPRRDEAEPAVGARDDRQTP